MKKVFLTLIVCGFAFCGEFTPVKVPPQKAEKIMQDLHRALKNCNDGARIKSLSKELENALFPLEDFDFSHDYDPEIIDELRRIDRENKAFLTKFALTSSCKLSEL